MNLSQAMGWWLRVHAEIEAVVPAPTRIEAAGIVDWWHHDWAAGGDTATRAAGCIRRAAKNLN